MIYEIPNQNNLYGTISNIESKKALADMFATIGWKVRKASWTDFEVRIAWGEITIQDEDKDPLINGGIDPTMFDAFRQILDSLGVGYSLELYDDQRTLIKEEKSKDISV